MERGRAMALVSCALALGVTGLGCGGSDDSGGGSSADKRDGVRTNALGRRELPKIDRMLTQLVNGLNRRDRAICNRAYTQRYIEQLMEQKGAAARAECRRQVARAKFKTSLIRIERAEVERAARGRLTGRVQFLEAVDGRVLRVTYIVVRDRDTASYRIASGRGEEVKRPKTATTAD